MRSTGGSTPWSKIRICVRSRIPKMWPSTVTRSRRGACGCPRGRRECESCSAIASRRSRWSVGGDVRRRPARRPALVVHGDRVEGHVRVRVLDVALEDGDVAAEAHRADPGLVQEPEELLLELRDQRIRVAGADRPGDRLLGEMHRVVGRAADPDPDDPGQARLPAGADDRLEHELLDPLHAVGGDAHLQEAHVLRAGSLRDALDVEPVPVGDEVPVDDRNAVADVRPGVLARERVDGVRAQRVVERRAHRPVVERLVDPRRVEREVLADAAVVDGDPGVLADEVVLALATWTFLRIVWRTRWPGTDVSLADASASASRRSCRMSFSAQT